MASGLKQAPDTLTKNMFMFIIMHLNEYGYALYTAVYIFYFMFSICFTLVIPTIAT